MPTHVRGYDEALLLRKETDMTAEKDWTKEYDVGGCTNCYSRHYQATVADIVAGKFVCDCCGATGTWVDLDYLMTPEEYQAMLRYESYYEQY